MEDQGWLWFPAESTCRRKLPLCFRYEQLFLAEAQFRDLETFDENPGGPAKGWLSHGEQNPPACSHSALRRRVGHIEQEDPRITSLPANSDMMIGLHVGRRSLFLLTLLLVTVRRGEGDQQRFHQIQHGQCTYTFILPEDGQASCREARGGSSRTSQHDANAIQRDAPPAEPSLKIQQLESVMQNYTLWLQKVNQEGGQQAKGCSRKLQDVPGCSRMLHALGCVGSQIRRFLEKPVRFRGNPDVTVKTGKIRIQA